MKLAISSKLRVVLIVVVLLVNLWWFKEYLVAYRYVSPPAEISKDPRLYEAWRTGCLDMHKHTVSHYMLVLLGSAIALVILGLIPGRKSEGTPATKDNTWSQT